MNSPLVLVTGGTGFIGESVVHSLRTRGYSVRVLARPTSAWPFDAQVERAEGDVRNLESLRIAMKDVQAVVHLASAKNDERESEAINMQGAANVIQAAKDAGIKKLLNISTQSAKLKRKGLYGRTKDEADKLFEASGLPVLTLRASLVYGDATSGVFGSMVRFSSLPFIPVFGSGNAMFRPIHRDDLAEAVAILLSKEPFPLGIHDAGGPQELSFNDLIRRILRAVGKNRPLLHIPVWIGLLGARILSVLPRPPITVSNVLGGAEELTMDTGNFATWIGFTPRSFEQGLQEVFPHIAEERSEAAALLQYVMHPANAQWKPSEEDIDRYLTALKAHQITTEPTMSASMHSSLPQLDLLSRLKYPESILRQKLMVAAAIVECHPASAQWLLPKDRSLMELTLLTLRTGVSFVLTLLRAIPLALQYSTLKRNVGA